MYHEDIIVISKIFLVHNNIQCQQAQAQTSTHTLGATSNKLQIEDFHWRHMTGNRLSTTYIFVQSSGKKIFSNFSLNIREITSASCCHHKYKTSLFLCLSVSLSEENLTKWFQRKIYTTYLLQISDRRIN
jgi:hypothetical protein